MHYSNISKCLFSSDETYALESKESPSKQFQVYYLVVSTHVISIVLWKFSGTQKENSLPTTIFQGLC